MSEKFVVIISADVEWGVVKELIHPNTLHLSPYGEWFSHSIPGQGNHHENVIFFHGGWGKISAAASTQYILDHYAPRYLINLGTCGGIAGRIDRGKILLASKTIVYDIVEQMGDYMEHIRHYTTELDLSFIRKPYPTAVTETTLISGDRDIIPAEIPMMVERFGAVAADWESGAIAFVAQRNQTPLLILRGVTDLVGIDGGEAYGNLGLFERETKSIMKILVESLGPWIDRIV